MAANGSLRSPGANIAPYACAFELGLGVLALFIGWFVGHSPLVTVGMTAGDLAVNLTAIGWGCVAALPMLALFGIMTVLPLKQIMTIRELLDRGLLPLFAGSRLWELAAVACAAGVGEELLFRGLLQPLVASGFPSSSGVWIGLGASSLAFGVCHWLSGTYAILATCLGLYLGGLFLWTDNLLAPATAHALYDLVALIYLVHSYRRRHATPDAAT